MRARRRAPFALLLAVAGLLGCRRGGCHRADETRLSPRDEVYTALIHFREAIEAGAPDRAALATQIVRVSAAQDASFAKYGDVYHHHVAPEPAEACIAARTCYGDYLRFLSDAEQAELGPTPSPELDARAQALANDLSVSALEADVDARVRFAIDELPQVTGAAIRGDGAAERTVYLLSTGHAIEARRDAAIARILTVHPHDVRFVDITPERAPKVFAALGRRLTAVALIDGRLCKDVVEYEQWLELLFPNESFPPPTHRYADLAVFDAHEHVAHGGGPRLRALLLSEQVTGAVAAALPTPSTEGIAASSEDVLAAARSNPPVILPFVTIDDASPDAPDAMRAFISRGARGLKLLTGHGAFHDARGKPPLDRPAVDAVFTDLEERGMPVLWHVNTQLYADGFLTELERHPRLIIVNPHLAGYLSFAPALVRSLLVRHPNLYIDLSLGTQPRYLRRAMEDLSARRDEWRALLTEFSDRFMFGLDMVVTPDTSAAHARMLMKLYRSMLEDEDFDLDYFPERGYSLISEESQHHAHMPGLALPREVLQKIYLENARRLYGAP